MQKNENDLDRVVRAGISVAASGTGLAIGGPFNPVGVALLESPASPQPWQ